MLGQEASRSGGESRRESTRRAEHAEPTQRPGLLGRSLPYLAAFGLGFLLGRRSGEMLAGPAGDTEQATSPGQPIPTVTESGEQVERESASGAGVGAGVAAQLELGDIEGDEAVQSLSPPTTRGMPMLGLGTYQMDDYEECYRSVRQALAMGYRHVDTAAGYDNEDAVGDAIADSDVPREELFVATKVSPENLDYDHVLTSAADSLEQLGLDYVDLLYVHWPTGEYEPLDTLEAFAELRDEGLVEEIGVSNFTVDLLDEAVEVAAEPIFANQVEMHPLLQQTELQQYCAKDEVDVKLVAYSPIARSEVEEVEVLEEIADDHDASPEQVSLAWLRAKEVTAIPKASDREHLRENWLSLDVELDDEEIERIDDVDQEERLVDPDRAPWNAEEWRSGGRDGG